MSKKCWKLKKKNLSIKFFNKTEWKAPPTVDKTDESIFAVGDKVDKI